MEKAPPEVTADDFIAYLREKRHPSAQCPSCKNNSWSVVTPDAAGHAAIFMMQKGNSVMLGGGPSVPLALIGCNVCGFIMPYALALVQAWKAGKGNG